MKQVYNLTGQNTAIEKEFFIFGGAADIELGSFVERGNATATLGAVVKVQTAASGPVDLVGLLEGIHDYDAVGDWTYNGNLSTKTNRPETKVDVNPFAVYEGEVEVCATQVIDVTAGEGAATTEVTLNTSTSAADIFGGGWMYNATANELRFFENHEGTGNGMFATDVVVAWSSLKPFIIPPRMYGRDAEEGATYSAGTSTKPAGLIYEGNENVLWQSVIDVYIQADNLPKTRLNPGLHDAQTYTNPKFMVEFIVTDRVF